MGPGTPSSAAGRSAAVFTGTVLSITDPASMTVAGCRVAVWQSRIVRLRVGDTLSGIPTGQAEVEVVTGLGGGDCGFPFQTGKEYFVYADRNPEGKLRTGTCDRTRPIDKAAEDLAYLRATAGAPETGRLTVRTTYPGFPGKPGIQITAQGAGERHFASTNGAGEAVFENLPPGIYRVHFVANGDLPDDPKFQLGAKGVQKITLLQTLRIRGRITTRQGQPPTQTDVELRSTSGDPGGAARIGSDGSFEIRLSRTGRYHIGVNLNGPATADSPYPRWFHPGTEYEVSATVIEFSGETGGVQTYDLTLPDRRPVRMVEGTAILSNGSTVKFIRLFALDLAGRLVAQTVTDQDGGFRVAVPADGSYRLHAVWLGANPGDAMSAVPIDIEPGLAGANLRIALTQSGNSYLDALSRFAKPKP